MNWKGFKLSSLTFIVEDSCLCNFQDPHSPAESGSWAKIPSVLTLAGVSLLIADISHCQSFIEALPFCLRGGRSWERKMIGMDECRKIL